MLSIIFNIIDEKTEVREVKYPRLQFYLSKIFMRQDLNPTPLSPELLLLIIT